MLGVTPLGIILGLSPPSMYSCSRESGNPHNQGSPRLRGLEVKWGARLPMVVSNKPGGGYEMEEPAGQYA